MTRYGLISVSLACALAFAAPDHVIAQAPQAPAEPAGGRQGGRGGPPAAPAPSLQPLSVRVTNPPLGGFEIVPFRGGIPIVRDGRVIAAIGVGGAAPATDEKIAQAGANAAR